MPVDPLSMATFGVNLLAEGVGVAGGIEQSIADEHDARMNAYLSIRNAKRNASMIRKRAAQEKGEMVTQIGGSGLALSGSMKLALEDFMVNQELDALEVVRQGELQAAGFTREAEAAKDRGRTALIGGILGVGAKATKFAGTDLLSGKREVA